MLHNLIVGRVNFFLKTYDLVNLLQTKFIQMLQSIKYFKIILTYIIKETYQNNNKWYTYERVKHNGKAHKVILGLRLNTFLCTLGTTLLWLTLLWPGAVYI